MTISQVSGQAGGVTVDGSGTISRAYPSNVTVGNVICVAAGKYDLSSVTFSAGDVAKSAGTATIGAFTLHATDQNGSDLPHNVAVWTALVTGSGSLTLTVTGTAGSYWWLGTDELTSDVGFDSSREEATAQTNPVGGADSTPQFTGNMTSAGGAAFFGAIELSTGSNISDLTEDAAFTRIYREPDGTAHVVGIVMVRIVSSGTTDRIESSSTTTGNVPYIGAGVVLKEIGAAGDTLMGQACL